MGPLDATSTQVVHLSPNIKSMSQNQNRMICRQARELTILTVKFEVRARKITTELKAELSQNLSLCIICRLPIRLDRAERF